MIEVQNLTKYYGKVAALRGISFSVKKGEILGFLGPNGAGKTTAMRIITGYLPATSGAVKVAGFDVSGESIEVRKRVGYLPETVPLYADMTVSEFLRFYARLRGVASKDVVKRCEEVMESCSISDVKQKLIKTLSKGYRQRVGVAQALVHDPEILILDEPTIGLDPKQIIEIRELIKSFAGKRTVLLSTHILPEVSVICSRIAIIHKGELIALDTEENLAAKTTGEYIFNIAVKGPNSKIKAGLKKLKSVKDVDTKSAKEKGVYNYSISLTKPDDGRSEVSKFIINNGWDLLSMESGNITLEDIFIKLVNSYEGGE